ncbi:MAG: 50S ribosomal protein L4 [Tannerellaceae bacterium]|jgi:large subunit ribosomal protein L4|nr:50S ribosomal protein L4 [Tannerellaceae bacterium]
MKLSILNIKGEDTGRKITLDDAIFGIEPNDHAIYLDVKQYMANKRQGTHKAKERSEVSGSTRKLIRQKGGGGARRGDIKSPVLIGGGRVFGPKPRNYSFKLNKKVKSLARKSALSYKAKNDSIIVIEDIKMANPKTKEFVAIAERLQIENKKMLLVLPEYNKFIYLSARNLQKANVIAATDLNTYTVLNAVKLVLTESSVAIIEQKINNRGRENEHNC